MPLENRCFAGTHPHCLQLFAELIIGRGSFFSHFDNFQQVHCPELNFDRIALGVGALELHLKSVVNAAQLAGFGLAIVTDATLGTTSTTQCGSSRWMAPELLDYQLEFKRTKASDVYAFACLCIEVIFLLSGYITGEQPFRSIQPHIAVILQILDQKRPPRPSGPPDGTRAMSDGLWARDFKICPHPSIPIW
ncbi:hypothetical protein B0H14DRAFT_2355504 [Mycena olivaceomarginata]|nr:hypothetical protein B0H14DRAFT_2355504 [Mycena olivaceomarginata]